MTTLLIGGVVKGGGDKIWASDRSPIDLLKLGAATTLKVDCTNHDALRDGFMFAGFQLTPTSDCPPTHPPSGWRGSRPIPLESYLELQSTHARLHREVLEHVRQCSARPRFDSLVWLPAEARPFRGRIRHRISVAVAVLREGRAAVTGLKDVEGSDVVTRANVHRVLEPWVELDVRAHVQLLEEGVSPLLCSVVEKQRDRAARGGLADRVLARHHIHCGNPWRGCRLRAEEELVVERDRVVDARFHGCRVGCSHEGHDERHGVVRGHVDRPDGDVGDVSVRVDVRAGTRGAAFLSLGVGARAQALGGAYSAMADDISALYWNSAGIAQIDGFAAGVTTARLFTDLDIQHTFIGAVLPVGLTRLGVSVNTLDSGEMPWQSESWPNAGFGGEQDPLRSTFSWTGTAIGLHIGRPITDRLTFGGAFKFIEEGITGAKASYVAVDLGTVAGCSCRSATSGCSVSTMRTRVWGIWTTSRSSASNFSSNPTFGGRVSVPVPRGKREEYDS